MHLAKRKPSLMTYNLMAVLLWFLQKKASQAISPVRQASTATLLLLKAVLYQFLPLINDSYSVY